jgi:hypothetical protein
MGDPGFFSFLKDKALSLLPAIPVVGPALSLAVPRNRRPTGPQIADPTRYPVAVRRPGPLATAQRIVPGGETGLGQGCGKGQHPNKSSYWLKDGTFVEKGTRCVTRRRRFNPANAQATSRSIGRINSAKRMQGALSEISTGKYTAAGKRKAHTHS